MKVSTTTVIAFAAVAHGAAHLQPYNSVKRQPQPQVAEERALKERDIWSDLSAWWNNLVGGSYPAPSGYNGVTITGSTIGLTSSIIDLPSLTLPSISDAIPTISIPGANTGVASGSQPTNSATPSGTASVGTSLKPVSSSAAGTGSASVETSVKPATSSAAGTGSVETSVKPASSTTGASASAPSSVKPTASASSSVNTKQNNASGSSASACTKKSTKSRSGTGAVTTSKSASGTGASSVKPTASASSSGNGASSVKPTASASSSGNGASSVKPTASASSSVNTKNNNASGSSASACTKTPSKSRSGTGASGTAPASTRSASKSASASASGTGVKTSSKAASGTGSSRVPSQSASASLSTPSSEQTSITGPSASAPAGTIVGQQYNGVDQFINIPYAQPPVGPLRFKPPVALNSSLGVYYATSAPNSCPQFATTLTGNYSAGGLQPLFDKFVFAPTTQSEDCLTINVFRPNNTAADAKLPVLYWIYGGGWQFGSTSMYNGTDTVRKSVQIGAPIIVVAVNYRLGGFGFLHGADLAAEHSTNLGLRDQWLGLQWVSDNIDSFGGDSSKVTLWGESAGSISAAYLTTVYAGDNKYNGKPLFRGSIHNSGAIAPADNGTAKQAQEIYDHIIDKTGCSASTASDRLACLRSVDFVTLHNATTSVDGFGSYRSADLPYLPRTDDNDPFYNFPTEYAIAAGRWTRTPFIIGDQEDEGTLLAIVQNNITTNDQLVEYVATWFPNNPNAVEDVRGLAALYPDNVEGGQPDGSPFHTGSANNLYPQYKRLAAILGDIVFIITRRAFLTFGAGQGVKCYSYIATYLQGLANFGTLHGSDLAYLWDPAFAGSGPTNTILTHYISFVNYLDPNMINSTNIGPAWPAWNNTNGAVPDILYFGAGETTVGNDTFRNNVWEYLLGKVTVFRV